MMNQTPSRELVVENARHEPHCSCFFFTGVTTPFVVPSTTSTSDSPCSNIPWNPPTIFHPDLIATVPQMSLPEFCAQLSLPSISFRSVRCRRAMSPRKVFTTLAKFYGSVTVNDFWSPCRLQELLFALLRFQRSFCFT